MTKHRAHALLPLALLVVACGSDTAGDGFWTKPIAGERLAASADGHVLVADSGCTAFELHRDTGDIRWFAEAGCGADVVFGDGDDAYVLGAQSVSSLTGWLLTRLDGDSGEVVWQQTVGSGPAFSNHIAAAVSGRIAAVTCGLITGTVTRVCTVGLYETEAGTALWSTLPVDGPIADVAIDRDGDVVILYTGTDVDLGVSNHLLRLDGTNGSTLADVALAGGGNVSLGGGALAADALGGVFVGGDWAGQDGAPPVVYSVDADGQVAWSVAADFIADTILGAAALPGRDAVCVSGASSTGVLDDAGGVVALLDASTGAVIRQVELGLPVLDVAAEPGSRIYLALDNQIMALQW